MKKITLGCSVIAMTALFLIGCNKKANVAPEQDMEFQSSKDAAFANSLVTEIDIIAGYLGEREYNNSFFNKAPGSAGAITITPDTLNKKLSVTYSGSVTCSDGKRRDGTIVLDYSASNVALYNAKYYRDAGFVAKVTLNNYWVEGWTLDDAVPFVITNNAPFGYDRATTDLSWTLDGYFSVRQDIFVSDSSKSMIWKGKLVKTLTNTEDVNILKANKQFPINWALYNAAGTATAGALVAYTGSVTGVTSRIVSYNMFIDNAKPETALVRDFKCAPEKVLAVTSTPTVVTTTSEWHPFISGVASFTSNGAGTTEPRLIDFGSGEAAPACDNAGFVTIKGITYAIDFKK
ncbi:MAG: hypothetical protein JWO32_758 [Bacteroidetes bacterium]|nr:hypothetical protein [Bacteroidota bacterium]